MAEIDAVRDHRAHRLRSAVRSLLGLDEAQRDDLFHAGLLHDLGKLRVPDEVLDKPGPLNDEERAQVQRHSFETYEMLRRIPGLEQIASWAAYHHEAPNGHGYPFRCKGRELGLESRIVAVADVFQALAQNRPYREGMPLPKILDTLDEITAHGRLDPNLVSLVKHDRDACLQAALLQEAGGRRMASSP
jgi:HD-GYP domain-containing protein (c-di-GMP phosphodiesterase class II)